MVLLKLITGTRAGSSYTVSAFPLTIGRSAAAGLRLEEPGVWENHLQLELQFPAGFRLTRHADAHATVNGQPFTETFLRNGDLIELGAVKIQFWIAKAEQIRLRWREWLTWLALILLTAAQVALIYWLPQ
jgi:hypothetical protein